MQTLKQHIIQACKDQLSQKINDLTIIMQELAEAGNADTKSSAGDKHETSRAMVQLEQEKTGTQLKEAEDQLKEFERIDFRNVSPLITQSSLVETNRALFFIAASIGKLSVGAKTVFVISNKSPLAMAFSGKKEKDTVVFNGVSYHINAVM